LHYFLNIRHRLSVNNKTTIYYGMRFRRLIPVVFIVLFFSAAGCRTSETGHYHEPAGLRSVSIRYARGFRIDTAAGYVRADVLKPWQGKQLRQFRYLVTAEGNKKDKMPGVLRIRHYPQRIICTSTTHIAFLEQLDELDKIVAISGKTLINNPYILKKTGKGEISDIGYDKNMDFEQIVRLHPDLVFLYGIGPEVTTTLSRLLSLNIPAVIVGDYLESSPLGRAEWIKFMAAFFGKEKEAVRWFDSLAIRYESARFIPGENHAKWPLVMTGLPWNEVWYVTGGNGMLAAFIRDAGGHYVWKDLEGADAVPMEIEQVYRQAGTSDIWINCGTASSLQDILHTDDRLGLFAPVQTGHVYNNNARVNDHGGNDYWESGVVHPDLILQDLRHIFHPRPGDGYRLYYYRHLQ